MKKIILIAGSFLLLTACSPGQEGNNRLGQAIAKTGEMVTAKQSKASELTEKKDGIEVTVEIIEKTDGKTVVRLTMNNHRYDLSTIDIQNLSSLNSVKPTDYQIEKTLMGGHHVTAKMTFPSESEGPLIIGLNENLIFNFNLS